MVCRSDIFRIWGLITRVTQPLSQLVLTARFRKCFLVDTLLLFKIIPIFSKVIYHKPSIHGPLSTAMPKKNRGYVYSWIGSHWITYDWGGAHIESVGNSYLVGGDWNHGFLCLLGIGTPSDEVSPSFFRGVGIPWYTTTRYPSLKNLK